MSAESIRYADQLAGAAPIPAEVAQKAIEWLIDLQSIPVAPSLLEAWKRWRAAHPDHERAWQRIESVNGKLTHLSAPLNSAIAKAALTPSKSPKRRQAIAGIAALLFTGSAAWIGRDELRWQTWTADERTAIGERRTLTLADGTTLHMNSNTAVSIAFTQNERRLRLIEGEIMIATAKDLSRRQFLVETAQGEALALGTRYTVRRQEALTEVAVYEGAVQITPRENASQALVLNAGEQTGFTRADIAKSGTADSEKAAWTQGFIVARSMRLADFLVELNRYSERPLRCDSAVADLRVSGSYPLADIDLVLETVALALSLQVETITRFWGMQTVSITLAPNARSGKKSG